MSASTSKSPSSSSSLLVSGAVRATTYPTNGTQVAIDGRLLAGPERRAEQPRQLGGALFNAHALEPLKVGDDVSG